LKQEMALTLEIETAVKLLRTGLAELQCIDGANDFYHLPFLLLSSGFERLMKCMICLKRRNDTGNYPATNELKTHDLMDLKNCILSKCISKTTAFRREATKEDYHFMTADADFQRLLGILSLFGEFARYYNLDVVTGSTQPTVDAKDRWEKYEQDLVNKHAELPNLCQDANRIDDFYREINRIIVSKLERFARALARQFTLGDLGPKAKSHTGTIGCFLFLTDDGLGRQDYMARRGN